MNKFFLEHVHAVDPPAVATTNSTSLFKGNLNTSSFSNMNSIANDIITLILEVAGALAIIYLIYSGILYITAAGNPDAAKKGQQGVINAIIGIIVITLAFFIARAVVGKAKTL